LDGPAPNLRTFSGGFGFSCHPSGNLEEVPFDIQSIPLEDWLKDPREAREIPWVTTIGEPQLQMDQRTAVHYRGAVDLAQLKPRGGNRKLVFAAGVTSDGGQELVEPTVHAADIPPLPSPEADINFFGCLYFRPGTYTVWLAVYDAVSGKHSLTRKKVRVTELKDDPLPMLESRLPAARFPAYTDEQTELEKVLPESLLLPVANKRPLIVDVISLIPQADVIGLLTQLEMKEGRTSVTTINLEEQRVVYDSNTAGGFDFTRMLAAERDNRETDSIPISALQRRSTSAGYLKDLLERRIKNPADHHRVVILVSSPVIFPRGGDISPIELENSCGCSLIHLRLGEGSRGDDLQKMLKSPPAQRFEIISPLALRRAIAQIVQELEAL